MEIRFSQLLKNNLPDGYYKSGNNIYYIRGNRVFKIFITNSYKTITIEENPYLTFDEEPQKISLIEWQDKLNEIIALCYSTLPLTPQQEKAIDDLRNENLQKEKI